MRNLISRFGLALLGLGIASFPAAAQTYSLSTAVTYSGRQTGDVWVVASPLKTPLIKTFKTRLSAPVGAPFTDAPATVTNVVGSFYLFAWRDSIPNGEPDPTEAQGWHPGNPFVVTDNLSVSGFEIIDPDTDADNLPDWWEAKYGLPIQPGSGNSGALALQRRETIFTDGVWASVVGSNPAGLATLNISTNHGFASNDLVLIITMQDPNVNWAQNQAGTFEFARVAAASSNLLTLRQPRTNTFSVTTAEKIQVLKVPEYTDVTLPPDFALQFDGTNDYVSAGNVPLANTSFTIEAWARRASSGTIDIILGQGGIGDDVGLHFGFHQILGNKFVFGFYNDDLLTTNSYTDSQWHHWAGTYNATNKSRCIYQDGVLVASNTALANYQGTGPLLIATPPWGLGGGAFDGSIDEVRVWNHVRSQAEIQANMGRTLTGTESGLLAYFRFDEGTGTNVSDATGHGYDGILVGPPTWGPGGAPASLTCQPWDGTHGGVLAFVANHVTVGDNCLISADGKGYRGGDGVPSQYVYQWGKAGERTAGFSTARETDSLERPQGGGGAGKGADGAGGGGGYGTQGGDGGKILSGSDYGRGALAFGDSALTRLYPGGGGGGAGSHDSGRPGIGGSAGGGIIFLLADTISGNGLISSKGADGLKGYGPGGHYGAGGGGGAGGSIYLTANVSDSIDIRAGGGAGGPAYDPVQAGPGGAGGAGRIRLDLPPEALPPSNMAPAAGYTNQSLAGLSLLPDGDAVDSDQDGLSDLQEYQLNTSPINPDTDGDTLPDKWEADYGLNPLYAGDAAAGQDEDGDHVDNVVELYRGTRPDVKDTDGDGLDDDQELFVYHTDPLKQDTDGDGMTDGAEVAAGTDPLFSGIQYIYDALQRLVGVEYENGLSLGYGYDANNNILRQVFAQRDANTNHLPDVWEFIHGLTNNTSGFVDTDGDGWSDYEEWLAGTDPRDPASQPKALGSTGTKIASLQLPFTPSDFVVGMGQLDGIGAEEIVIGADGNPGTKTNFLLVLTQTASAWSTQRVDIGRFGVTSIAVGQPANRPSPAIYLGLREQGGTGRVAELMPADGQWTMNTIAVSTNEEAFVLGVQPDKYVLASLAAADGPPGCPHYLFYSSDWTNVLATSTSSHRGLGTMTLPGLPGGLASRGLRLLDTEGIQVVGHDVNVPTNAIWNADYGRWFFLTANALTWGQAQSYANNTYGGNLATVTDDTLNTWLWNLYGPGSFWIGLSEESSGIWQWASGKPFGYANWASGEPNGNGSWAYMWADHGGQWDDATVTIPGAVEVNAVENHSLSADEPSASREWLWRGHSLTSGNLRLTNSISVLYAFVDDRNLDDVVDGGDDFVLAEYLYSGSALTVNDVERIPISGSVLAQSYGLACVEPLYGNQQALFTAEPDGRIFCWTADSNGSSLQRQLFYAQDTGKAWHALAAARTLDAAQSLVGLRVDPAAPERCDVILWPPQQQVSVVSDVPQTAPVTQILASPNAGRDIAQVNVRIWDQEGSPSRPELQYRGPAQGTWSNATIAAIDQGAYGLVATDPTGLVHDVSWDAARDLGAGFTNIVTLRARAQEVVLSGDWSPSLSYLVQNSLANNPRAYGDAGTTIEGLPVDIDVLANDTVEHGAPKLIAALGMPAHGSAVTNLNRTVRYTPAPGFAGTDQFVYTLTDGAGAYSMATVTVIVMEQAPGMVRIESPNLDASHQFSMWISGPAGRYRVQSSTNLTMWSDASTVTNQTGTVPFIDQVPSGAPARYYRALLLP